MGVKKVGKIGTNIIKLVILGVCMYVSTYLPGYFIRKKSSWSKKPYQTDKYILIYKFFKKHTYIKYCKMTLSCQILTFFNGK